MPSTNHFSNRLFFAPSVGERFLLPMKPCDATLKMFAISYESILRVVSKIAIFNARFAV